ncbi:uncharacterized protein LOC129565454 isoform X2 [Sitodiplosis mosellana]|uniref:uncharacterized protein LOC129565454 isoform X2 n=1 Tax=Sitodiplosis mosellana TaxID=263140 RepID=UPI002443E4F8|nr:uncharacterized protein LOC129565454 isoform X2 [Sitodiplosis mosellana]XP_055296373.1 uncharacterized protein LOC129565454 isoform X2 [Sitodiplosis mosellana]
MCRCCQSCFEDCYWYCIEERFCFDKNIANYNADEDEYLTKRGKGFNDLHLDANDRPICEQPVRQENGLSSKIREDDYRQIQTNVPFLAPEILAVFANSQIFHDSQPNKSLAIVHKSPGIHDDPSKKHTRTDSDSEKKLLKRLEGIELNSEEEQQGASKTASKSSRRDEKANELILRPVPIIRTNTPSTSSDNADGGVDSEEESSSVGIKTPILNKRLRTIQSLPYFSFRPASETDIFTIAGSSNMISMTPEIPSISYTTLPKHFVDTPTIEKYKESVSLYSIQTSNKERATEADFTMPRYFGKGDMIAQSVENLSTTKPGRASPSKKVEKSKRLKLLRANLPPLSIHINKEKSKERKIE